MVVAHNGASCLPWTLESLAGQSRPADFVIGIDSGSTDESSQVLQSHLNAADSTVAATHKTGFGTAVRRALETVADPRSRHSDRLAAPLTASGEAGAAAPVAVAEPEGDVPDPGQEWLWLLHDDSAPAADALEELLTAVELAPSATIAGCKQLEWDQPRTLIDAGLSTSRWGERLSMIDVDELDQGQYDGRSDVFAVNSAGMLIRRDVFDSLDGFDPALPGVGDDVDLCWRNRLAGHRVVVVPTARMHHKVQRPHETATVSGARRSEVYLRLKHARLWKVPFLAAGALSGSIVRFLLSIIAKDPAYGAAQLVATLHALLMPITLMKGRRRAARTRRVSRTVIRGLQTPRREVWAHRRSRLEAFDAEHIVGDGTGGEDTSSHIPTGDSDDFVSLAAPARSWSGTGAVAAALMLTAVSFVGLHRLFGAEALSGGALLPVSQTMSAIFNNASSWWISLGAGFSGHGDPFDYVLWVLAALGLGNGSAAVLWLTLLALPLAGLSAWAAMGALTQRRFVRFWAALLWASVPAFQVALGSGRLGALLAHLLIPWVVLGMLRAVGAAMERIPNTSPGPAGQSAAVGKPGINGRPSWTAAAAAGLALAALTASAPSLLPLAVVAVAGASIALRSRAKTLWWSLLPSFALFVPFAVSALDQPRALLADPGRPLLFTGAPLWQQFLGYPVALELGPELGAWPGLSTLVSAPWPLIAALVIGTPLLLLAVSALFFSGRRGNLVRGLWLVALVAAAASMVYAQFAVSSGSSFVLPVFGGPVVSLLIFMLLAAAAAGSNTLLKERRTAGGAIRRGPRMVGAAASVLMLLGPATSLALWVVPNATGSAHASSAPGSPVATTVHGARTMIEPASQRTLPATATDRAQGPAQTRTLVLEVDGEGAISAALMRGGGTTMDSLSAIAAAHEVTGEPGQEEVSGPDAAEQSIREAVAMITAGEGVDPRELLEDLGTGFVVLQESNTAAELLAGRIDAVPGLAPVGKTESGWLWRVRPAEAAQNPEEAADASAAVRIVDGEGRAIGAVAAEETNASAEIPAGSGERRVVLAERADPAWTAWLDGQKLSSTTQGWSQAFELPADGGSLEIRYAQPWAGWWAAAQIVVIGLTILLAVPLPAKRRNTLRRSVGSEADRPEIRTG